MAAVHPGPEVGDAASANGHWFARSSDDVAATLHVDSKQVSWAALGGFVLAVLATQMDAFRALLDTVPLGMDEWRRALIPPVVLLAVWELAKFLVRRNLSTPAT